MISRYLHAHNFLCNTIRPLYNFKHSYENIYVNELLQIVFVVVVLLRIEVFLLKWQLVALLACSRVLYRSTTDF